MLFPLLLGKKEFGLQICRQGSALRINLSLLETLLECLGGSEPQAPASDYPLVCSSMIPGKGKRKHCVKGENKFFLSSRAAI